MKRSWAIILFVVIFDIRAQQPVIPAGSIEGTTTDATTGRPLPNVRLTVGIPMPLTPGAPAPLSATSDADGHFAIKGLRPGTHLVNTSRDGYSPAKSDSRKAAGNGVVFTLGSDQQLKDVVIRLFPQAVITGKVFDTNGSPVLGANVSASQVSYDDFGENAFTAVSQVARTDDTGSYRIFGLSAGEYFIRVSDVPTRGGLSYIAYVIFYPLGSDRSRAQPVYVKSGEELALSTIVVPVIDTGPIRFNVVTDAPNLPDQFRAMQFLPRGVSEFASVLTNNRFISGTTTFEHPGLPVGAGEVRVALYLPDGGAAFGQSGYEIADSAEKPTVNVVLRKGVRFSARVVLEKQDGALEPLNGVQINVMPATGPPVQVGGKTDKDGMMPPVASAPPSQYRLRISGLPEDTDIVRLMQDGKRLSQPTFMISTTDSQLEIVATNSGSVVDGVVRDSRSQIATGSLVALIPAAQSERGEYYLYRSATSDQNGKFTLRNIQPGTYKLFAWINAPGPGPFRNTEFVAKYEDYGKPIEIGKNARTTTDLRLADEVP